MSRRQTQVFVAQQLDFKIASHGMGFKHIFLLFSFSLFLYTFTKAQTNNRLDTQKVKIKTTFCVCSSSLHK